MNAALRPTQSFPLPVRSLALILFSVLISAPLPLAAQVKVKTDTSAQVSISRKLYNLMLVEPGEPGEPGKQGESGERGASAFSKYNGLVIKTITINRLEPFGSSLARPDAETVNKSDKLLNDTHTRTRERIVGKYLLFAIGDTISDLALSETERNLRKLTFINDARIVVRPSSDRDADIIVITRDDYSLGGDFRYSGPEKGEFSLFERNLAGLGHEIELGLPYNLSENDRVGLRFNYRINNIAKAYTDIDFFFKSTYLESGYGFNLMKDFISAETDYAGGISMREVFTTTGIDTIPDTEPLEFTYQDYWIARSFMIHRPSLSRLIFGARYIHNNVYERPDIDPLSYYSLQKYRLYLASVTFSTQNFYKTNFIYNYGRTEDIPYGGLAVFVAGNEFNEFKTRKYIGTSLSWGNALPRVGHLNLSFSAAAFLEGRRTEQGIIDMSVNYFSNLLTAGNWKFRHFARISHTKGFDRYSDEYLTLGNGEAVTGFTNDSLRGQQRSVINLETVAFSPLRVYGFRFVFFGFADLAFIGKEPGFLPGTTTVTGIGGGVRIRNDNLVISTLQIRLTWFPGLPPYSGARYFNVSGESLLRPRTFDAGAPSLIVYR